MVPLTNLNDLQMAITDEGETVYIIGFHYDQHPDLGTVVLCADADGRLLEIFDPATLTLQIPK